MSKLFLYHSDASPPSSAVRALAEMMGVQLDFQSPQLEGGRRKPEFLKLNPMGTVPTLQDDDFVVSDSHAIMVYLLTKYGGDKLERLYPSDVRTRAVIDQIMHFDTGVFFIRLKDVVLPTLFFGLKEASPKQIEDIEGAFGMVEAYLASNKYIACDHLTLADLAVGSTASTIQCIHKLDASRFPRTAKWLELLYTEPEFKKHVGTATESLNQIYLNFQEKNRAA